MSMFFEGVDNIEDVPEDPFFMPDGEYTFRCVTAEIAETQAGGKQGLKTSFICTEQAYFSNKQSGPWLRVPRSSDADLARLLNSDDNAEKEAGKAQMQKMQSNLLRYFKAFGFGEDEMLKVRPEDLLDRDVKIRVKNEKQEDGNNFRKAVRVFPIDETQGNGTGSLNEFLGSANTSKPGDVPF